MLITKSTFDYFCRWAHPNQEELTVLLSFFVVLILADLTCRIREGALWLGANFNPLKPHTQNPKPFLQSSGVLAY